MAVQINTPLTPSCSTPSASRRKSLHTQNLLSSALLENNDEAERLARRREINTTTISAENVNTKNKRQSLGLSFLAQMSAPEIKDKITECVKLSTENKINVKNAFSLEIIDFMTYMIKKKDANMTNLQLASTSLDVSTKIYGFRVDGVYTQLMKMAGGLDKERDENSTDDTESNLNNKEAQIDNLQDQSKKRKKKSRVKIFGTVDSLKGIVETMKPSLWIMENEDSQTTDALYQVMLSNHASSKFYLHMYNDVMVDTIEHKINSKTTEVAIPRIEDFSEVEICLPLTNFEFQGWTNDNEEEEEEKEEDKGTQLEKNNEDRFQFDLDASLPSENEAINNDISYLDIQNENENVDRCIETQKPIQKIVDLCKVVSNTNVSKKSEYSFLQKNISLHWAGPSHWRLSNWSKLFRERKIIETCQQKPDRKRKEIELCYSDSIKEAIIENFLPSKALKLNAKNIEWQEEVNTLPRDMNYNIASASRLYLYKSIDLYTEKKDKLNATRISDIDNYDYNNENDVSDYCPNVSNTDYGTNEYNNENECNNGSEHDEIDTQMIFTGDNLVSIPKLTNKISIAYSIRVQRIDMRQLKKSIWKSLTLNNVEENTNAQNTENQQEEYKMKESKSFSEVYKTLPDMLTKNNKEALSFPISFVSLLHLANEKTLKIQGVPDMSDLIVETN
ncbi:PREDICTED: condensin complex subunit 2-like [Habropoda laboriosa]|uniref:condensin complex subunit 2-like n=1 Tax=Habropoda laboriosa TaxID=597456 RepID=UPI00083E4C07|nr:PREDICTED: condensin complex subunit 2-like [Habropoda laboriosa]